MGIEILIDTPIVGYYMSEPLSKHELFDNKMGNPSNGPVTKKWFLFSKIKLHQMADCSQFSIFCINFPRLLQLKMDKITLLGSGGGEPTSYIILICKRQPPPCSCPTPSWLGWRKSPLLYEPREKLHRPDASPTAVEKTWGDCSANVG